MAGRDGCGDRRSGFLVLTPEGPPMAKAPSSPLPVAACIEVALGRVFGDRDFLPFIFIETVHPVSIKMVLF